jgi:EF hand
MLASNVAALAATGLCGRNRCLHSLVLVLGLAVFSNPVLAQERGVDKEARFQIWRTTTVGSQKGVDGYRNALDAAKMKIGDAADEILGRPAFSYVKEKMEVELTLVSAAQLGVETESTLANVYHRARQLGLELCPPEVGPQLRLDYRDQPVGESLLIAMEPVKTYYGDLTILSLINFGSGLALVGSNGRPEFMVPRYVRFVFALPMRIVRTDPPPFLLTSSTKWMDANGDGTISWEEFQAAYERIFKTVDSNKDGRLTPKEMEAFMPENWKP